MDNSDIELQKYISATVQRTGSKSNTNYDDVSNEYDEYQALKEKFTGERLKKLVRKTDMRILPPLILIYLLTYVDRTNVGNAKLFGAAADLGMSGQQWNTALSVFFVTYALGGVPSQIGLKRWGPRTWLPIILTSISIVLVCTGLQNNFGGWTAFRMLLGLVEAGMYPGCSVVLTEYYAPDELQGRMTILYSAASAAGAFSGLLAYGIGQLDYVWGYRGWRWIYCVEGLFTFFVGIAAFFFVPGPPSNVKTWLSAEEKRYLLLRRRYGAGGESRIAEQEGFSMKDVKQAFKSPHTYAIAITEFSIAVTVYGYSFVLPTVIKSLGYTNATAQAMTAPPYIFACIVTLFSGWAADRYKQRTLSVVLPSCMAACGFVITIASTRYEHLTGVTLFGIFLMTGGLYPVSPAVMAWVSLNMSGAMKRAVGMALMISFSQLGGIMGSNIFLSKEAPTYPTGFGICLAMLILFAIIWPLIYASWLRKLNRQRAAMSIEEVYSRYTEQELVKMGDESPLFRYST